MSSTVESILHHSMAASSQAQTKGKSDRGTGPIGIWGVISDHSSQHSMIGSHKIRGVTNSTAKLVDKFERVSIVE